LSLAEGECRSEGRVVLLGGSGHFGREVARLLAAAPEARQLLIAGRDLEAARELAAGLGVTSNAVRAQIVGLERDGIVRAEALRRSGGKPSTAYGLTPEFEPALSRAYIPLLMQVLRELNARMPEAELRELMAAVGRRWAAALPRVGGDPRARAEFAARLLGELGGVVEIEERDGEISIRGVSCPLGALVRERPQICGALEALLGESLGVPLKEPRELREMAGDETNWA
jgi:predicted ArsR family transcriptional regulator